MKLLNKIYILFFIPINIFSQVNENSINKYKDDFPVRLVIKSNPIIPIWGQVPYTSEFRLVFEKITAKKQSLQLGLSYFGKSSILSSIEKSDSNFIKSNIKLSVSGFRFQISYKFYLTNNAPKGLYIAPHFSYANVRFVDKKLKNTDRFIQATYTNYSIIAGYQFVIKNKLCIDPFIGIGYKDNSWNEHYNQTFKPIDEEDYYIIPEPLKIYLGFNIGLAF